MRRKFLIIGILTGMGLSCSWGDAISWERLCKFNGKAWCGLHFVDQSLWSLWWNKWKSIDFIDQLDLIDLIRSDQTRQRVTKSKVVNCEISSWMRWYAWLRAFCHRQDILYISACSSIKPYSRNDCKVVDQNVDNGVACILLSFHLGIVEPTARVCRNPLCIHVG